MKYSEEVTEEICKFIKGGAFNKDAATMAGIHEDTFYEWMKKPEFSESIKKAEAERKVGLINRIVAASKDTWQAAAWYLERVYHDEFSKKEIREHDVRESVIAKLASAFKKKDDGKGSSGETKEGS